MQAAQCSASYGASTVASKLNQRLSVCGMATPRRECFSEAIRKLKGMAAIYNLGGTMLG